MVIETNELTTLPEGNYATLMITLEGHSGELREPVNYDLSEEEIKRVAEEAVAEGVLGLDPRQVSFADFVVDRIPEEGGMPARLNLRPKVAFG